LFTSEIGCETTADSTVPIWWCKASGKLCPCDLSQNARIVSADVKPSDRQTAADFKKEHGGLELRERRSGMHDPFIIINRSIAYVAEHSLKDVDSKDTTLTDAPDPKSVIDLFEDRWKATQS
jgi:hypothetical protein